MPLPCRPADFHKRKHDGLQLLAQVLLLAYFSFVSFTLKWCWSQKAGARVGLWTLLRSRIDKLSALASTPWIICTCIHAMMADCVIRHNYRPKNCIPLISSIACGNSKREGNQHQHRKCKGNHPFSSAKHRTPADFDSAPPRWKFVTFLWAPLPPLES